MGYKNSPTLFPTNGQQLYRFIFTLAPKAIKPNRRMINVYRASFFGFGPFLYPTPVGGVGGGINKQTEASVLGGATVGQT